MGYLDGKWAPLIMITVINTINGMVNALIKKVLDGGINHMVIATYRLGISTLFLLPIAYFWERKTRPKLTTSISCQHFFSALFGYTSATLATAFWGTLPALTFIMALIFGSWMLIQAKINVSYPCPYSSTVILSVFGTLQCAILSFIKTRHVEDWILGDKLTIFTVIIAGVIGQGMCTVGISWCIKQRGPVFTAAFSPVTLMSATVFDFVILHRMIYVGR
ncbi:hypothetical protein Bca52824_053555 [Brassica carinata]|uniref:WAT1-related protein n=1 Tax=Brassica carinata TaxID=52824 RepID=A0A8X7R5J3_BRACI|nr:hypothetical protein Bca52824_053555 [Brassica carinata]